MDRDRAGGGLGGRAYRYLRERQGQWISSGELRRVCQTHFLGNVIESAKGYCGPNERIVNRYEKRGRGFEIVYAIGVDAFARGPRPAAPPKQMALFG